ncbi:helix-turn-helix domain-containing protein [Xylocopilactobacillus apicola]|uniref:XRE family transcriptional regulator n=1 Tax=Xylocopilactobacillus apicola TaxID=2932184 RepID=A0AAU9D5P0_9LACO|nr:RodZ domain-containing protein [Xylocopilactobacillus apicola]BDR58828.1 XRE family transcriptional regulator [Xylocopilactobacillus apicola]
MNNIGKVLRQARIDKGMTIDDLQKKTRIQKRYLIAIENGDFDQLPGQFYVRAFIKQYGEQVGVDTDPYFAQPKDVEPAEVEEYEEETPEKEEPTIASASPYLTRQQPRSRWHSLIPQILVIAAVVLVVFVVWFFYQRSNNSNISDKGKVTSSSVSKMHNAESKSSSTASSSAVSSSKKSSSSKSKPSKSSSSAKEEMKIEIKGQSDPNYTFAVTNLPKSENSLTLNATNGNSWDKVVVDGAALYTGVIQAGQSQTISIPDGAKNITVTLGATSNSEVKLNSQSVDLSNITSRGVSNLIFNLENSERDN